MNPYILSREAVEEFKKYHGIFEDREVARLLGMTPAYWSLLLSGKRRLNEFIRQRIQMVTRLPQDKLFLVNPHFSAFSHQSQAYLKYFGVIPYSKFSTEFNALEEKDEAQKLSENTNGHKTFFNRPWYKGNGNGVSH